MSTLFQKLSARVAGDGLRGRRTREEIEAKLSELPTERRLELRADERARRDTIIGSTEAVRTAEQEEYQAAVRKRLDEGKPTNDVVASTKNQERECARLVREHAADLGLRAVGNTEPSLANVLEASAFRVRLIEDGLAATYRMDGLPAGAVTLKQAHSKAVGATWPLQQAVNEAKKSYRGLRNDEAEAACHRTQAALDEAMAEVEKIKRELWDRFAVTV